MLFNSYEFIFLFLPITLLGFFALHKQRGKETALNWLVVASFFFYGWWNPVYIVLIISSICINFGIGKSLSHNYQSRKEKTSRVLLTMGIIFNFALLGYFKYANFFVTNLEILIDTNFTFNEIILPLAISFFTFQQIAYLIDAYRGLTNEYKFSHYVLFVTFFPQLIAGPIVHHKEMLPQFMDKKNTTINIANIAIGVSIFSIGLFKKAVLADSIAMYATPVFQASENGEPLTFFIAWGGALAYTFQLYFDFSGYSDMAIGAARLFGIKLPLNFHSPYQATSIIEFWRRWHVTLSRFLRDYLYFSLGGNKKGKIRRYINLFITMLLGGLWHGAGWTFILWGGLHGLYLSVNHLWRNIGLTEIIPNRAIFKIWKGVSWLITFIAIIIGWVFFRAANIESAIIVLEGMFGFNGISIPNAIAVRLGNNGIELLSQLGISNTLGGGSTFILTYLWIIILFTITLLFPNTQQIMRLQEPTFATYHENSNENLILYNLTEKHLIWKPTNTWSWIISFTSIIGILALSQVSEFLYFQF